MLTGHRRLRRGSDHLLDFAEVKVHEVNRPDRATPGRVALSPIRWDERTRAHVKRRTTEGPSKTEIIRYLERIIARELSYVLRTPFPPRARSSRSA